MNPQPVLTVDELDDFQQRADRAYAPSKLVPVYKYELLKLIATARGGIATKTSEPKGIWAPCYVCGEPLGPSRNLKKDDQKWRHLDCTPKAREDKCPKCGSAPRKSPTIQGHVYCPNELCDMDVAWPRPSEETVDVLNKEAEDFLCDQHGEWNDEGEKLIRRYAETITKLSKTSKYHHELSQWRAAELVKAEAERDSMSAQVQTLLSIAKRWTALDYGGWHPTRHQREKAELLKDTHAVIASNALAGEA